MTRSILIYPDTLGIVLEADLPDVEAVVPGLAAAPHAVEGEASQVAADAQPEVVPCPLVNREIVTVSTHDYKFECNSEYSCTESDLVSDLHCSPLAHHDAGQRDGGPEADGDVLGLGGE